MQLKPRKNIGFDLKRMVKFILSNRTSMLAVLLFFLTIIVISLLIRFGGWFPQVFAIWLDPLVALISAFTALMVWNFTQRVHWEQQLEKRLNVHFVLNGEILMSCFEAHLAHEGDIRQWAQQIGRQWIGGPHLKFEPFLSQPASQLISDGEKDFRLYTVTLFLTEKPPIHPSLEENQKNLEANNYLVWVHQPVTHFKETAFFRGCPAYQPGFGLNDLIDAQKSGVIQPITDLAVHSSTPTQHEPHPAQIPLKTPLQNPANYPKSQQGGQPPNKRS